jgi:hypothetical protein
MTTFKNHKVAETFARYPSDIRRPLIELRELIIQTAAKTSGLASSKKH